MIAFIDDHRGAHGVEPMCKVLPLAPSTYHAQAARRADPAKLPPRTRRDLVLTAHIRRVFVKWSGLPAQRLIYEWDGEQESSECGDDHSRLATTGTAP